MTETIAILGAGAIGASWSALFLAQGFDVRVHDPAAGAKGGEGFVRDYVAAAWPAMTALGLTENGDPDRISFWSDPAEAATGARFVQENAPERLELKRALLAAIAPALEPGAVVSSSTSGIRLSALREGFPRPESLIIGHPFNPPHLVPLVELYGADAAVARARALYERCGKVCVRLRKEAPGHVANRLQAALWREAIHLVVSGVASVEDVDKAVAAGPGLRWSIFGPHMVFNLAAGGEGIGYFCDHIGPAMAEWWADLGAPELTPEVVATLASGLAAAEDGRPFEEIAAERDRKLVALLKALRDAGS